MKTLSREEAGREFERWWNDLEQEWFKVEVLQDYSSEDYGESLREWFNGNKKKAIELLKKEAKVNDWVKSNKDKKFKSTRIHIVEEPYTDYLLWEIEGYKIVNVPLAKEEVFLVKRKDVEDLDIPDGDFMIFDNSLLIQNYYTPQGKMHKADFYYKDDDIGKFLELKNKLLSLAKPI